MIKLFEEFALGGPKYKVGQMVYYNGMHKDRLGLYKIEKSYYFHQLNIWRYDIYNTKTSLHGVWEKSLSETEEESKLREEEYIRRREKMKEIDPYGEENWDEN